MKTQKKLLRLNGRAISRKCSVLIASALLLVSTVNAEPPSHDPSTMIQNTDGRYWIFTTGVGPWCMSSSTTSFSTWQAETAPYTSSNWPSWITTYVPSFAGTFWAPEIIKVGSEFRLYYSASTFGSQKSCIGLATATSLNGPWTDKGMVVYTNTSSSENAIDPAVYAGGWMSYGSFFGGIRLTALSSNGKATGSKYALASGDCEAPYILKNGSYYYLFINRGSCCQGVNSTTYRIQVGRSTSITGPFVDKSGVSLNSGGGSTIAQTTGRYIGPGHFGYGNSKVTYHFYDGTDSGNPKLRITTLSWSNSWPVISGGGVREGDEELEVAISEIVSLHPNPVKENILGLTASLSTDTYVKVNVIDLKGSEVRQENLGLQKAGIIDHEINVSGFAKGTYVVRLEKTDLKGQSSTVTKKVVIE